MHSLMSVPPSVCMCVCLPCMGSYVSKARTKKTSFLVRYATMSSEYLGQVPIYQGQGHTNVIKYTCSRVVHLPGLWSWSRRLNLEMFRRCNVSYWSWSQSKYP